MLLDKPILKRILFIFACISNSTKCVFRDTWIHFSTYLRRTSSPDLNVMSFWIQVQNFRNRLNAEAILSAQRTNRPTKKSVHNANLDINSYQRTVPINDSYSPDTHAPLSLTSPSRDSPTSRSASSTLSVVSPLSLPHHTPPSLTPERQHINAFTSDELIIRTYNSFLSESRTCALPASVLPPVRKLRDNLGTQLRFPLLDIAIKLLLNS